MKIETEYERAQIIKRNGEIRSWHRIHPEISYADLGRVYHLSKQRIAIILNGTGKPEAAK